MPAENELKQEKEEKLYMGSVPCLQGAGLLDISNLHGMIPELEMGGTFTRDSVANYLNTRIFVGE